MIVGYFLQLVRITINAQLHTSRSFQPIQCIALHYKSMIAYDERMWAISIKIRSIPRRKTGVRVSSTDSIEGMLQMYHLHTQI